MSKDTEGWVNTTKDETNIPTRDKEYLVYREHNRSMIVALCAEPDHVPEWYSAHIGFFNSPHYHELPEVPDVD